MNTSGPGPLPSGKSHRDVQKRPPADGDSAFRAQDIRLKDQNQCSTISTQGQCLQNDSLLGSGWVVGFVFVFNKPLKQKGQPTVRNTDLGDPCIMI